MIRFATVKELRQDTPRLLAEIGTGERFVITKRGKPVAVLAPFAPRDEPRQPARPFAEAWEEIESCPPRQRTRLCHGGRGARPLPAAAGCKLAT